MAEYEVLVTTLGANPTYSKGDIIDTAEASAPKFDWAWLERMESIKRVDDNATRPEAPAPAEAPAVQSEAGSQEPPAASAALAPDHQAGPLDVLDADQQAAMRAAGLDSAEMIRIASDDDLLKVEGIGPATLRKLREATAE
jgi:predicted flap endonuclease-1-like 5' DNA nuclease